MRRMAILSPAAPGAHFCIVWYCFTAEIAFLHNAASAQGGDSRLTAEFSRRRLAPRADAGQVRLPHRYTVGRMRRMNTILHGESTSPV